MIKDHLARIREKLDSIYSLSNLSTWIEKNTTITGHPYSYKDREYQRDVIDNPAKTLIVVKCAQVGLSEIFARWSLAAVSTQDNFTIITTFPNATDAEMFSKSRLEPIITASKALKSTISSTINSVELRKFGENSFIYTRGTKSETGALSVPADLLLHDEYDRSDMDNISAYVSRLQAKPTKMRRLFSTPTVAKYGIDAEANTARRYRQVWKCNHCNHSFLPTYEADIKIPGYDGEKKHITKQVLKDLDYKSAVLLCPSCGRIPSSSIEHRQWVLENPQDNYEAVAYFITPFCAPAFLTPAYLVKASTEFKKWSEFKNQALGETEEDAEETLTRSNIESCAVHGDLHSGEVHYMGADMGLVCHIVIGRRHEGKFLIVHKERVAYTEFETKRQALCVQFRISVSVHDLFPYTDMIARITNFDPNAYGAIYVQKKSSETYTVREQEENEELGKLNVRALNVNREVAFDALMGEFKRQMMVVAGCDETFIEHLLSMKRVQKFDKYQNLSYHWVKTDGEDHYHHAVLYFYMAVQLAGTNSGFNDYNAVPLVTAFKPKTQSLAQLGSGN